MRRMVGRLGLWLMGWRVVGGLPEGARAVLVGHPHTSTWDFPLAVLATWSMGVDMKYIGKASLFNGPFAWLFRGLGGIPVDRSKTSDTVAQIAERFALGESLVLGIAPSGTRRNGTRWKSGFYHIARAADVPVALGFIDFSTRRVGVADVIDLTGDVAVDMARVREAYRGIEGRNPQSQCPVVLADEEE